MQGKKETMKSGFPGDGPDSGLSSQYIATYDNCSLVAESFEDFIENLF